MEFNETFEMKHTKKQDQLHLTNYSQQHLFLYNRDTKCNMCKKKLQERCENSFQMLYMCFLYNCQLAFPLSFLCCLWILRWKKLNNYYLMAVEALKYVELDIHCHSGTERCSLMLCTTV